MQSVTVLMPNARRHVVKVEPNKTILWILEQACTKYKFNVDEYDLKQHNKVLDLSLMFRFSGIPNNATLEMIPIVNKRTEQELVICLQLEDGTRVNGNFSSSTCLREIITKLCPEKSSPEQSPVVIYMRSEYFGDKLDTSLRIMGLSSGGRALLRLVNTDPESLKSQANVSSNLPQKPREPSPEVVRPKSNQKTGSINVADQIKKIKQVNENVDNVVEPMEHVEEEEGEKRENPQDSKEKEEIEKNEKMDVEIESSGEVEDEPEPIINYLDDRGTIMFSMDSIKSSNSDVPDSFFDLTEADIRLIYRELKQQVNENENRPLMTSGLRKLEESKKILNQLSIYKTCAIRIQMPNRIIIQTKFSTIEKVEVVIEFVRKFLINPTLDFYLFTTPPKQILDKNETLIESSCVPSALLHFGCDTKIESNLIKDEFLEKLSSGSGASRVLVGFKKTQNDNSTNPDEGEPSTSSSSSNPKPTVPNNFMTSKASSSASGNVPKWFKFGK